MYTSLALREVVTSRLLSLWYDGVAVVFAVKVDDAVVEVCVSTVLCRRTSTSAIQTAKKALNVKRNVARNGMGL